MNYRIYIPTRGRVGNQLTMQRLPKWLHAYVTIVCPKDEVEAHGENYPTAEVAGQPSRIQTISAKRAWIAELASEREDRFWFQMDDDLNFFVWNGGKHTALHHDEKATNRFFRRTLPVLTENYTCVGFGTKGFALPGGVKENYHLGFVFGMERVTAIKKVEWNRIPYYEDIDYTLQLLRGGVRIAITYDVVVEQRKANAAGGISDERTDAKAEVALHRLVALHPGIVSLKPPSDKHPYSNTRVSWQKAAAAGGLLTTSKSSLF